MNFYIVVTISYSILIAGIIGAIRFSKIRSAYYPFIFLVWLGCANEALSHWLLTQGKYNIVNSNIYAFAESLLLLWFFRNLGVFRNFKALHYLLITMFTVSWVIESFFIHSFGNAFNSYYTIISAFPIVLLSINTINHIIVREKNILKTPEFLISIGIVIFFTYRIITEVFWLYGLNSSSGFRVNVYTIMLWINLVTNLIYALAVLWMQKRQAFTLPY